MPSKLIIEQASGSFKTTISFNGEHVLIDHNYRDTDTQSSSCDIVDLWQLLKDQIAELDLEQYIDNPDRYQQIQRLKAEAARNADV